MLYTDHCEHGRKHFIGEIEFMGERGDFYLYPADPMGMLSHYGEPHFCFRYGDKPEQYESGPTQLLFERAKL